MADDRTDKPIDTRGTQFCEYVLQNGEYVLAKYHTHEGFYCSSYEENAIEDGPNKPVVRQRAASIPGSDSDHSHRRYALYQFKEQDGERIAVRTNSVVIDNDPLPLDLFEYLEKQDLDFVQEALLAAEETARRSEIEFEVAIGSRDLGDDGDEVEDRDPRYNPKHGYGIYEFHHLDDGKATYLPVIGHCKNMDDESATKSFFPTDLMAYLQAHGETTRKAALEQIGEAYLKATERTLRIVLRSRFFEYCATEGHDRTHGGV